MGKRMLSAVLVIVLMSSFFVGVINVSAEGMFSDIENHWAKSTIEELAGKGIINGKGDGKFDPEGKVTRAEFIKLLVCAEDYSKYTTFDTPFSDVSDNDWFKTYIAIAIQKGIISSDEADNGSFMPNEQADRDTAVLWMTRDIGIDGATNSTKFADDAQITHKSAVSVANQEGLIAGDAGTNMFRPNDSLSRAEAATIIKRVMNKKVEMDTPRAAKNIVDFNDDLKNIAASSTINTVDENNEEYCVIGNADEAVKALKEGEVFKLDPTIERPEVFVAKVKSVSVEGNKVKIYKDKDVQISDIYDEIDISTTVYASLENIKAASLPDGVSVTNEKGQSILEAQIEAQNENSEKYVADNDVIYIADTEISGSGSKTLSYAIDYTLGEAENGNKDESNNENKGGLGLKAAAKVSGTLSSQLSYNVDIKFGFFKGLEKAEVKATAESSLKLAFTGSASATYKVPLGVIAIPVGPTGVTVNGTVYFQVGVTGKIELSVEASLTNVGGGKYENGDFTLYKENQGSVSASGKASVEVKVGPSVEASLAFAGDVIEISLEVGGGVKAKFEVSVDAEASITNEASGTIGPDGVSVSDKGTITGKAGDTEVSVGGEASASLGKDGANITEKATVEEKTHNCVFCIDGNIKLYLGYGFKAKFGLGKWEFTIADVKDEFDFELGDCHISKYSKEESVVFDWGKCTNYTTAEAEVGLSAGIGPDGAYLDPIINAETSTGRQFSAKIGSNTTKTGSVSEENPTSTFNYTAKTTGKYYVVNTTGAQVLINIDGEYRTNEGYYDLTAGKTYQVSVEWRLDDTNYSITIYAPSEMENISGCSTVEGGLAFKSEIKRFSYVPSETMLYDLTIDDNVMIIVKDSSDNEIITGSPSVEIVLEKGKQYYIEVTCPTEELKEYTLHLKSSPVPEDYYLGQGGGFR